MNKLYCIKLYCMKLYSMNKTQILNNYKKYHNIFSYEYIENPLQTPMISEFTNPFLPSVPNMASFRITFNFNLERIIKKKIL